MVSRACVRTVYCTAKRVKTSLTVSNRVLIFADASDKSSQVFAIILHNKTALSQLMNHSNLCNTISIGDMVMIYEPTVADRTLGGSIPILQYFTCIVPLKTNIWHPEKEITMSSEANNQIHFVRHSLPIELSVLQILTQNQVPCIGTTCDRQTVKCTGCHGMPNLRKNFVFSVNVEIKNQRSYNAQTGIASFVFRSYNFTKLLLQDIDSFCRLDLQEMQTHRMPLRKAMQKIVSHVNNNGGWTVIGWHRKGIVTVDGITEENTNTKGHIIRLEPTNKTLHLDNAIHQLKYKLPRT